MSEHADQQTELRADSANNTVTKNRRAEAEARARPISTLSWSITLFGTAIGAGVLFLPIDSGRFGFWPLLIATILIGPMVFLSHRAVSRLVAASPHRGQDILVVLSKYFGPAGGALIALVYWLCLFPVVLIYGVSITNTVDSFIVNQLNGPSINRALLSLICVGAMTASFAFGQRVMMKVAQIFGVSAHRGTSYRRHLPHPAMGPRLLHGLRGLPGNRRLPQFLRPHLARSGVLLLLPRCTIAILTRYAAPIWETLGAKILAGSPPHHHFVGRPHDVLRVVLCDGVGR